MTLFLHATLLALATSAWASLSPQHVLAPHMAIIQDLYGGGYSCGTRARRTLVPSSPVLQPYQYRGFTFSALCPSKFEININLTRVPQIVPEVRCLDEVIRCHPRGHPRGTCKQGGGCKQLYSELVVDNFVGVHGQRVVYSQVNRFGVGCVCGLSPATYLAHALDIDIS